MKTTAIIQARMGSTRLPGKVLMKLNGESVLQFLLNQISYSKKLDDKIIATSTNSEDDVIEEFARKNNISFFRGDNDDVLDRYYRCAKKFSIDNIVRLTADNPFIDPIIMDSVIDVYSNSKLDYVNNFNKKTFPYGMMVEVFSFKVLEEAWKFAKTPYEREHVTPYVYNESHGFRIDCLQNDVDLSTLRLSVDTINDLKFARILYQKIKKKPILLNDILKVIAEEPEILSINKN